MATVSEEASAPASPAPERSLRRSAALGVVWATIERCANQLISFFVFLLLVRLLAPRDYGLVAMSVTVTLLAQTLVGETFADALIQRREIEPAHTHSMFWFLQAVGIVAFACVWFGAALAAIIYRTPEVGLVIRALSPVVLATALAAVPAALLKRALNFRAVSVASGISAFVAGVVAIAMAFRGFGVWSLVANSITQSVLYAVLVLRAASFRPSLLYSRQHMRDLLAFGRNTFLLRLVAFVVGQSPRMMLGYFFGASALGQFSVAARFPEIMVQLLSAPASAVLMSSFARVQHDAARIDKGLLGAWQIFFLVSLPAFVGLSTIAPVAVPVLLGPSWIDAIPLVQLMSLFGLFMAFNTVVGGIMRGLGRANLVLWTWTLAAVTNIVLLYLTRGYGPVGATASLVLRGLLLWPFGLALVSRITGVSIARQWQACRPILASCLGMAGSVWLLLVLTHGVLSPPIVFGLAILWGGIVYCGLIFLLARPVMSLALSFAR